MVEADYDELLDYLMDFAKQALADHDELHPFAATMSHDGSLIGAMVDIPEEGKETNEILTLLVWQLKQQAVDGDIKAAGTCADVFLHNDEDDSESEALQFQLEHKDGEPIDVYLPYTKDKDGKIEWGELSGSDGPGMIFGQDIESE